VIFTVCTQSPLPAALLCYLASIPRRLAHVRNNPYDLINDGVRDPDVDVRAGVRHEVERQLALVAATGAQADGHGLSFPVRSDAREAMLVKARAAGADPARPWIVVHPGATAPSRRYPIASFAAALVQLALGGDPRRQLVLAGGPQDAEDVERLHAAVPGAIALAGVLSLPELAALIAQARLVICNNSGPAHLAAAVGTPVVDLYALTNPQHTPWGVPHVTLSHDVPCRGCLKSICPEGHHRCLAGVAPEAVVAAAESLYAAVPVRAAGCAA
jgi:lipopolysaccharide heptosyltransferase II